MASALDAQVGPGPDASGAPGRRRLFFALWPDEATRAAVSRASRASVRASGGRPTAKRNLHVTVAFLGSLDEAEQARAASVPPVRTGPFELVLDRLGYFEHSRVLWFGPSVVPPELAALEQALWNGLEDQGFEREPRIYRPHVTLARRVRAWPRRGTAARAPDGDRAHAPEGDRAHAPDHARAGGRARASPGEQPAVERIDAVRWPVAALTLVESVPLPHGVHYEPLQEWDL